MAPPAPFRVPPLSPRALLVALWTVAGLHAAWLLARPGGVLVGDAWLLLPFLLGSALAGRAAQLGGPTRRTWAWLSAGLACWATAQVLYLLLDALNLPIFPGPPDVFFVLTVLCLAAGLLRLRRREQTRLRTVTFALDTVLGSLVVCGLAWTSSLRTIIDGYDGRPLPLTLSMAYPVGDLLLCSLLFSLLLWGARDLGQRSLTFLGLGLLSLLFADLRYAALAAQDLYQAGQGVDLGWTLAATLLGTAAYLHTLRPHPRVRAGEQGWMRAWWPALPHALVPVSVLTFVLLFVLAQRRAAVDATSTGIVLVVLALFMVRQLVTLADQHRGQLRLRRRAEFDALTGLRNRAELEPRLQLVLDEARVRGRAVAVLFIDLDRMKDVNDTFGHAYGDLVLREVAARLSALSGPRDEVVRYGGDEFVLVVRDARYEHLAEFAARVLAHLSRPVQLGPDTVVLTASVGIAVVPDDAGTVREAVERADLAMYQGKQSDRNTWRFYNPALNERFATQAQLDVELRGALRRGEFQLVFQPIVNLSRGTVDSFEALLRWHSPALGVVPPSVFVPLAEERGMMGGLGRWALREALRVLADWRAQRPHLRVAVNISATQFQAEDFVQDVQQALEEHGLPGQALTLELTESAVVTDHEQASHTLQALRALGVRVALDDFGTGYSSLGHLRTLPVDVLKIDQSFVQDMEQDGAAFVGMIVTMAHSLGLKVVAEGIETDGMAWQVRALGCAYGQGYRYGRPVGEGDALTVTEQIERQLH